MEINAPAKGSSEPVVKPAIDLLRRVFIPIERRTPNGTIVFKTTDHQMYARLDDGSIRRADRKVRGKAARAAEKKARRGGKRS